MNQVYDLDSASYDYTIIRTGDIGAYHNEV